VFFCFHPTCADVAAVFLCVFSLRKALNWLLALRTDQVHISVDARDASGATPLHRSAVLGHTECVAVLLKAGATPGVADTNGCTALHKAAFRNESKIVDLLLESGRAVCAGDKRGYTPLHYAALKNSSASLRLLLANSHGRAVIEGLDLVEKCSALHIAAARGATDCVNILLDYSASVGSFGYFCEICR
jgi:ankyrin repeat protein